MQMLSEDDLNLKDMTWEELDRAWDLWFTLAQATNYFDPPYAHGVFVGVEAGPAADVVPGTSGAQAEVASPPTPPSSPEEP